MTDYTALDDAALNRYVAERAGYRVEKSDDAPTRLYGPDGKVLLADDVFSASGLWRYALETNIVGSYSTDLNVALRLPIDHLQVYEMTVDSSGRTSVRVEESVISSRGRLNLDWQYDDRPARAVAYAWLDYMKAKVTP